MIHAGQILEERWLVVSCLFERDTVEIWLVRDINSDAPLRILKIARTVENHRLKNEAAFYQTNLLAEERPEVYFIGKHQGFLFIVMEHLDELVPAATRKDYLRDVMTLIRIAGKLDIANLIYGDFKEPNLRRRGKDLKIIDFGTVRRKADAIRPGHRVGTYGYMAPEVALMRGQSIRSEIFALGHTARAICPADLRPSFEHVFARATEINAARRYGTYRALSLAFVLAPYRLALVYTRRIALVVKGAALAILGVIGLIIAALLILYFVRRNTYMKTDRATAHVMANVDAGLYHRRAGNFEGAVARLEAAVNHPAFEKTGYKHGEVFRILAECYRDGKGVAPDPVKSQYYRFRSR